MSTVNDPEAKCRIIAILDYWSQTALNPLHQSLLGVLKKIKSDATFNQGALLGSIQAKSNFHSLDLTNATDRIPISIQVSILEALIGPEKAAAWKSIMVDLPFTFKGRLVHYCTGQPMGAYSSWPMLAITHHVITQLAAVRAGKTAWAYVNYMILGDDIVLGDDDVAKHYTNIMSELGVSISKAKTHVSKDTYEFAKRWISSGTEITGISLRGLMDPSNSISGVYGFFDQVRRNWSIEVLASRAMIASLIDKPSRNNR